MISLDYIRNFFPKQIGENPAFDKQMLKEYLQLLILDFISSSVFSTKIVFIGGTNLRLIKNIDRFSEDLDFDCKDLSSKNFNILTDDVGLNAVVKQKESDRITAFRRSIYFPELLFDLQLSGYKEERLLVKIEAQDQKIEYKSIAVDVNRCGFFFPIRVPPNDILCAMKISALLSRRKGRDFYDTMFLLSQVKPNLAFLKASNGIDSLACLKKALLQVLTEEHLLFNVHSSEKILRFKDFVNAEL